MKGRLDLIVKKVYIRKFLFNKKLIQLYLQIVGSIYILDVLKALLKSSIKINFFLLTL